MKKENNDEKKEREAIANENVIDVPDLDMDYQIESSDAVVNENPKLLLSPMWFIPNTMVMTGKVGNVKFTILKNSRKTKDNHPDFNLLIASSYVKEMPNGEKIYPKSTGITGLWVNEEKTLMQGYAGHLLFTVEKNQNFTSEKSPHWRVFIQETT